PLAVTFNDSTDPGFVVVDGVNFGVVQLAVITGTVSGNELDNGVLNPNAVPLEGWTITLEDSDGNIVATTTTAADGSYLFNNIPAGDYVISQSAPAGQEDDWRQTSPFDSVLSFDAPVSFTSGGSKISVIAAADYDGDGNLDLAAVDVGAGKLRLYWGNGDGNYPTSSEFDMTGTENNEIIAYDENQDGLMDLAIVSDDLQTIHLYRNQYSGSRDTALDAQLDRWSLSFRGETISTVGAVAADMIEGNGHLELAVNFVARFTASQQRVTEGDLLVFDTSQLGPTLMETAGGPLDITAPNPLGRLTAADFNGDKHIDLAMTGINVSGNPYSVIFWGDGKAGFTAKVLGLDTTGVSTPFAIASADVNQDQMPDLAYGFFNNSATNSGVWFYSNQSGSFSKIRSVGYPTSLGSVDQAVFGLFDTDTLPDLLAYLPNADEAIIARNTGTSFGQFGSYQLRTDTTGNLVDFQVGDVNGDGAPDLIAIDDSGEIWTRLNTSLITESISVSPASGDVLSDNDFVIAQVEPTGVNGVLFDDANGNGEQDADDVGRAGVDVFLDVDGNLLFDASQDLAVTTVAGGAFTIPVDGLSDGTYRLALVDVPNGRLLSGPDAGFHEVTISGGAILTASNGPFDFFTTLNHAPAITEFSSSSPVAAGEVFSIEAFFTDSDSLAPTHVATVNWGDGTISSAIVTENGVGHVTASHVYQQGGFYNVVVTITDRADATVFRVSDPLTAEISGVGVHDGILHILGTDENDRFFVSRWFHDVIVMKDSTEIWRESIPITGIEVSGFGGNDFIQLRNSVHQPALLDGGNGNDWLIGGRGNDLILGGGGIDKIWGQNGDDTVFGGPGNDRIEGGWGNDSLFGDRDDDRLFGGWGNDIAAGGEGNDAVVGNWGNDILLGEQGNDRLYGSWGDNVLVGGDGVDRLYGGFGRDILIGGLGSDIIRGDWNGDILISGYTSFDDDTDALSSLLAEWTSWRLYYHRVSNLRSGSGPYLSGTGVALAA
ncbi:MAG: carboxypeptidase regulatory-like domain-containing protein, partial [Planctomycetaceae bacterium]|nr:carboxypeptidase regulatory-like domain-containing protein [Planctomycetaceae bacterium]